MSERFDRAAHLRPKTDELASLLADPAARIVPLWRGKCLVAHGEPARAALFEAAAVRELVDAAEERIFLGTENGRACFALAVAPEEEPSEVLRAAGDFQDLRLAGNLLPAHDAELCAYARAMLHWHRHHRHCAACGAKSRVAEGGHVRVCSACDTRHFPRTDPAVMALVVHGDRCLLARQAAWPPGMHSVLAGFVEPGETLEDAVKREVLEEVGLEVDEVRYLRSQPWPFPSSLMIGFSMRARSEALVVDQQELESARWFSRAEVAAMREGRGEGVFIPPPYSLAHQLIVSFVEG